MTYTTIFCIILKNLKVEIDSMCYLFRRYILSNYLNSLSIKKISFSFYSYIPLKRRLTFRIIRLVSQIREISYFLTRTFFTIISRTFPQNFTHLTFHQCYCHQYAQLICISLHFPNVFSTYQYRNPFDFWCHIERVKRGRSPILFTHRLSPHPLGSSEIHACSSREGGLKKGRRAKIGVYQRGKANAREQSQPRVAPLNDTKQTGASVKTIAGGGRDYSYKFERKNCPRLLGN